MDRREFLRNLLLIGAGYGLASAPGCAAPPSPVPNVAPTTSPPGSRPSALPASPTANTVPPTRTSPTSVSVPARPTAVTVPPPPNPQSPTGPQLAVARGSGPEAMTRAAIDALGGMTRFVKKGDRVVVKPNILTAAEPQYAVSTNPDVVAALVKLCLEAGASVVQVFDNPTTSVATAYQRSGIERAVTAAGGRMERMSQLKFKKTDIPKGRDVKSWQIYEDVLAADVLIDAAIAKTHDLAGLTMGMKNLMGILGGDRGAFHSNIGQRIADLNSVVRPHLTVIDAIRVLVRNGPTGGSIRDVQEMDTLIASTDIVAADSYGATLFGRKGTDLSYVRIGAEMGLGVADLSRVDILEVRA